MQTIGDLLSRDLSEPIEEVVKLEQQDEETVYKEITDYVATDRIKEQYWRVLKAIADAPGDPTEGVGVWISGFFGSGKSSFAKNLGYILANWHIRGEAAAEIFIRQLEQQSPGDDLVKRIADTVRYINSRFEVKAIMFDVQVDKAVRRATEPIAEVMYTVLLRELDYSLDYDIADLEIDLEDRGVLGEFISTCASRYADQFTSAAPAERIPVTLIDVVTPEEYGIWQVARGSAFRMQVAGTVLSQMYPETFPTPDSWAASMEGRSDINIRTLVDRTFKLAERRRPGHGVVFIIDEVGQYVARSADKIENLRAVVEHFGQESKNRVAKRQAVAPVWIIVTSQEKLEEVVAAIDDKRVDLAKLQDRFSIKIDMAPADIREVATKRVLAKKPEAEPVLSDFYSQYAAMLKTHTRLERTTRAHEASQDEFVQFYPYLPHFVDLSIDIVSGIRLEPGGPRHIGGSNRTIIKQAYEMLVHDRVRLMDAPVGRLVTLDLIYDLVEGNSASEKRKDIDDIRSRWPNDPWPVRTAKAIALLEYVRDLPRTEVNIAALLYDELGQESGLPEVQQAIEMLQDAQFIRQTEYGWKMQTAQEKSWTTERNSLSSTPRERNEIMEESLRGIFTDQSLSRYRTKTRTFQVDVKWDGRVIASGKEQIPLSLRIADGLDVFETLCKETQRESRERSMEVYWVISLNDQIDEVVAEVYRSRRMVGKYDQLRAQGKINREESASLASEKNELLRLEQRLKEHVLSALAEGKGYFDGNEKVGSHLGRTYGEIQRALFDDVVPALYPKLEMGSRSLDKKGREAEEILKAANLNGLPQIFYEQDGLGLVVAQGGKYAVNLNAPIIKEVLDYLNREHSYGNKVTGKSLEAHFGGLGYGWEQEMLWLVLATLLRGGAVEVTYQGRRYRNHLDPQVRAPFTGANAFRSASFAPRRAPDLQILVQAAQRYEALTGDEIDVEESAIAQAFQDLARSELNALPSLEAVVRAHQIPWGETLREYRTTLETIVSSASDDVVNMLAGEGESFREVRDLVIHYHQTTSQEWLDYLARLRRTVNQIWPLLRDEGFDSELEGLVEFAQQHLEAGTFYEVVENDILPLEELYREQYAQRYSARREAYLKAIEDIKAQPVWSQLFPAEVDDVAQQELQASLLKSLSERVGEEIDFNAASLMFKPSLAEMASDLAAVNGLRANILLRLQEMGAPEEKVESVRITTVVGVGRTLQSEQDVEDLLEQLRDHLLKMVAAGVKVIVE